MSRIFEDFFDEIEQDNDVISNNIENERNYFLMWKLHIQIHSEYEFYENKVIKRLKHLKNILNHCSFVNNFEISFLYHIAQNNHGVDFKECKRISFTELLENKKELFKFNKPNYNYITLICNVHFSPNPVKFNVFCDDMYNIYKFFIIESIFDTQMRIYNTTDNSKVIIPRDFYNFFEQTELKKAYKFIYDRELSEIDRVKYEQKYKKVNRLDGFEKYLIKLDKYDLIPDYHIEVDGYTKNIQYSGSYNAYINMTIIPIKGEYSDKNVLKCLKEMIIPRLMAHRHELSKVPYNFTINVNKCDEMDFVESKKNNIEIAKPDDKTKFSVVFCTLAGEEVPLGRVRKYHPAFSFFAAQNAWLRMIR